MKVSAVIITYNQENCLPKAIESALMQKTDFDFEVVVGEDCSTDGTSRVAKEFEQRYPDKVRAICREKNLGANTNILEALSVCRGEYVALLEGDDFWTDPRKLQLQADFLDAHPDCSLCCHAVNYVHEDGSEPPYRFPEAGKTKTVSSLEDILSGVNFHTCSFMFRRSLLLSPPDWLRTLWIGDWPMLMLLAEQGNVGYIDEVMSEYRMHPGGVWSDTSKARQTEGLLDVFRCARRHLGKRCSPQTALLVASRACILSYERESVGRRDEARQLLLEALGALLEETPDSQCLIDSLMYHVDILVNQTPTEATLDVKRACFEVSKLRFEMNKLRAVIDKLQAETGKLQAEIARRDGQLGNVSVELSSIKATRSWRLRQRLLSAFGRKS
jgi:glycosyltransferase involved in cell wall biosynthesis